MNVMRLIVTATAVLALAACGAPATAPRPPRLPGPSVRARWQRPPPPAQCLAAAVGWRRRERAPLLRLGLDHRARLRVPLPADPPQPRNRATGELAFYRCYGPRPVTLAALVKVGKGLTGLDEHQVRRWTSWYRRVTLAMLAAAVLAAAAALEHSHAPKPVSEIPLTRNEIAHLLATVIIRPAHDPSHRLHWSRWRRRHQHRARTCHYRRQAARDQAT
jgi:hypothetical protein